MTPVALSLPTRQRSRCTRIGASTTWLVLIAKKHSSCAAPMSRGKWFCNSRLPQSARVHRVQASLEIMQETTTMWTLWCPRACLVRPLMCRTILRFTYRMRVQCSATIQPRGSTSSLFNTLSCQVSLSLPLPSSLTKWVSLWIWKLQLSVLPMAMLFKARTWTSLVITRKLKRDKNRLQRRSQRSQAQSNSTEL